MATNPFLAFLEQQNPRNIYSGWMNIGSRPLEIQSKDSDTMSRYYQQHPQAKPRRFSPDQQRYFQGPGYDQVYNDYIGRLTNQIRGLDASQTEDFLKQPGLSFNDFLGGSRERGLGTFNPWTFWRGMTPGQRGENNRAYAPSARWQGFM